MPLRWERTGRPWGRVVRLRRPVGEVTHTITQVTREPPVVEPEHPEKRVKAQRWPVGQITAKMWIGQGENELRWVVRGRVATRELASHGHPLPPVSDFT